MTILGERARLIPAVEALRDAAAELRLPLMLPETPDAERNQQEIVDQLDDYVLPRLHALDAPLLAVIGGSTGAGKSTLVNSIIGQPVSVSGVLRPTTTSPVLVHNPVDEPWFIDERVLPSLARVTGDPRQEPQPGTVRLVESRALPPGMALLDAPDIDSVVDANRALADQLLNAADLWLFVTTANRYADAIPWALLRRASERGTSIAIVLDRVDPPIVDEVRPHLIDMLREQGLGTAPVFTVPEVHLSDDGLLPEDDIKQLRYWIEALSEDGQARSAMINQTLSGVLNSLHSRASELVDDARDQASAIAALRRVSEDAYIDAAREVQDGMTDGTLLRGEVLARWQEFVGTGELFRQIEARVAKVRDRVTAAIKGTATRTEPVDQALQSGVAALIEANAHRAATQTARQWRDMPGGEAILAENPGLAAPAPQLADRVSRLVRDWQGDLLDLVRQQASERRTNARIAAYGINGIGLFLMLITFSATGGLTGAEVGIAAGTTALAQKVLEAIFGDQAVRTMASQGRTMLMTRIEDLYAEEAIRHDVVLGEPGLVEQQVSALDDATENIKGIS